MAKVYNIGGVECVVTYKRDYNETFIHPANSDQWLRGEYDIVSGLCVDNGRDVCGGHEYYIAVIGDIRKPVSKKEAAINAAMTRVIFKNEVTDTEVLEIAFKERANAAWPPVKLRPFYVKKHKYIPRIGWDDGLKAGKSIGWLQVGDTYVFYFLNDKDALDAAALIGE